MYLSTEQGVYMTDGNDLSFIPLPDSLKAAMVTAFASLDSSRIVFGLDNGTLLDYNLILGRFVYLGRIRGGNEIRDIIVNQSKQIWVASYGGGISCFADSIEVFHEGIGLLSDYTYCLKQDRLGRILSGSDRGLNILIPGPKGSEIETITPSDGLADYMVTAIEENDSNSYWIGFESGYVCLVNIVDDNGIYCKVGFSVGSGVDKLEISDGNLWIMSDGNLFIYNRNNHTDLLEVAQGRKLTDPVNINDIHVDDLGISWIAAENGFFFTTGTLLTRLLDAVERGIPELRLAFSDRSGILWFSTEQDLYRMDLSRESGPEKVFSTGAKSSIHVLHEDVSGKIWIGTFNDGVYIFDPAEMRSAKIIGTGLPDKNVLTIIGDGRFIWISSFGGVAAIDPASFTIPRSGLLDLSSRLIDNVPDMSFVMDINVDSSGFLWIGTDGYGLYSWSGNELRQYGESSIGKVTILDLEIDPAGKLWFATGKNGLFNVDGSSLQHFSAEDGLRSEKLIDIAFDKKGDLVVLHQSGIDLLNPATDKILNMNDYADPLIFNSALHSIGKDYEGNVLIVSDQGILKWSGFNNGHISPPETVLTSVEVMNDRIDPDQTTWFKYDQNDFSFRYSGIWHTAPGKIRFRYKLVNLEKEWIETRSKQVSYSSLNPGTYTFMVQSSIYTDFSVSSTVSYTFTIRKPFWRQFWFLAITSGLLFGLLFMIIRIRENQLKDREREAKKQVALQLESLQNQVNPHFLFNSFNTLVSVIEEDRDIAIDYVENLSDFFRNVLTYSSKDLITLSEELELLKSYTYLQQKRYGSALMLETIIPSHSLDNLIPPLTLQILVENAIKHNVASDIDPLIIKIGMVESGMKIENNLQLKKKSEVSTRTGLENIISRYQILGGRKVIVRQEKDRFVVILPHIPAHD